MTRRSPGWSTASADAAGLWRRPCWRDRPARGSICSSKAASTSSRSISICPVSTASKPSNGYWRSRYAPPVGVRVTASQDLEHRRHRIEAGRRRLSGERSPGRFHPPLLPGRHRSAPCGERAYSKRPATTPRPKSMPRATAMPRSPPSVRGAAAQKSITGSRQQSADHRVAIAPAGQFCRAPRTTSRAALTQCHDGAGRRRGTGSPPALHLARPQERAAEPVSRCPA